MGRRPRIGPLLSLATISILLAVAAALLCWFHGTGPRTADLFRLNQPFVLATLSGILPLTWCAATAGGSSRRNEGDQRVAVFYAGVAALFLINRYDALVAAGRVGTVFVQPFVFPGLVAVRTVWSAATSTRAASASTVLENNQVKMAAVDERNRIAQELHDSIGQTLASVAMVSDALPATLARDRTAAEQHARRIRSMTLQALDDIRILLLDLRQPALEAADLADLLAQVVAAFGDPVALDVDVAGDARLLQEVTIAAYRITQQATANARRHADAHEIVIQLRQRPGAVTITIVDDGVGFDVGRAPPGHGLQIMRERAAGIGAALAIESRPGQGTRVQFSWEDPAGRRPGRSDP